MSGLLPKPLAVANVLAVVSVTMVLAGNANQMSASSVALSNLAGTPTAFTENVGQWPDSVLFRAGYGASAIWFSPAGAHYELVQCTQERSPRKTASDGFQTDQPGPGPKAEGHVTTSLVTTSFKGANKSAVVLGENRLDYQCNFFLGNNPTRWRRNVASWATILYKELYPGIDLKYYGNDGLIEYDFIVSPGADYSQIEVEIDGAVDVTFDATQNLVISTRWGQITASCPVAYQMDGSRKRILPAAFHRTGENRFAFRVGGDYDPQIALVIDPVLVYSTYLGGSGYEVASCIGVDSAGCAYVAGTTYSSDFPTQNQYQSVQSSIDAFVTKLNAAGNALVYSTYLGGSTGDDNANGIAVDRSGSAYIVGQTSSSDFPTQNPLQTDQGSVDAFVTKLSPTGNALVYSTYLGGSDLSVIPGPIDVASAVAVDTAGSAYVVGHTFSKDFPTQNAYQTFVGLEGSRDAFVTKFSASGSSLIFSTYLGGSAVDRANGIAVDLSGSAYIAGSTTSTNFPTAGPIQTYQGPSGLTDAFVAKLSASGNALVYSTYLGGNNSSDDASGIAIDRLGSAYVAGTTFSNNFPLKSPFQSYQGSAGNSDAFVTKLSPDGASKVYSTYLGGSNSSDFGNAIAVDTIGSAYVTGSTSSGNFPLVGSYQTFQGSSDVFVAKLSSSGSALVYSTYLGGTGSDGANGIAVDPSWDAYVAGSTGSTNFPTQNPFQSYSAGLGSTNVFVAKLATLPQACCFPNGTCADLDPAVCLFQGGQPGGVGSVCSTTYCPQPIQACCYPNGTCENTEPLLCSQQGGQPGGVGSSCATVYCPKPAEACCFPNGSCLELEPLACQQQGGQPEGPGSTCANTYCVRPPEACCFANGSCKDLEPQDCQIQGGVPKGPGTTCATTYCPRPPQACCLPNGTCAFLEPRECQQQGGQNKGPGSTCAVTSCPQPRACCFTDGTCQNLQSSTCQLQGGHADLTGKTCESLPCCCKGLVGNVDCDPADGTDISDLSALIDNLFISFTPLCCAGEANIDGQPGTDISDLSALIDFLFISFTPPPACQ